MKRKEKFCQGEIYHVFNKSIANYGIFSKIDNGQQFINRLFYYNSSLELEAFSKFLEKNDDFTCENLLLPTECSYIKFLAFNIMPDHYHLLIKIFKDNILSKYMSDSENSFSKFFNTKYERKGPLWQSSFKAVKVKNNEQNGNKIVTHIEFMTRIVESIETAFICRQFLRIRLLLPNSKRKNNHGHGHNGSDADEQENG